MATISRRRIVLITSSIVLLILIAISLATAIEISRRSNNVIEFPVGEILESGSVNLGPAAAVKGKLNLNDTGFELVNGWNATTALSTEIVAPTMVTMTMEDGVGSTSATVVQTSATSNIEGIVESLATPFLSITHSAFPPVKPTAKPSIKPAPTPTIRPELQGSQMPIMALTFSGDGGPKHCRGALLERHSFPPPLSQWKNGTCINIPGQAHCGVFFAGKGDNCEAHLFNMPDCYNSSRTYVNTVVFMPEERPVGGLWNSMLVKCGVEVPDAKMLDPSILGDALKKPGKGGG